MLQKQTPDTIVDLFGLHIDAISIDDAVRRLSDWIAQYDGNCRYVVTPNVDHLVQLHGNEPFQATYRDASLVVADGLPLVLAGRMLGKPIPERVAGSDLVPALFAAADREADGNTDTDADKDAGADADADTDAKHTMSVFLLGAAPGVAQRAAVNIESTWPAVHVTGFHSPPLGFEQDEYENQRILDKIRLADPDVLVIGLGAPKQELWVHTHRQNIRAKVAFCAGATIDFLAGDKRRAPRWVQKLGLEWCHRMLSDPRRLAGRYARDAWVFPQLVWHEMLNGN